MSDAPPLHTLNTRTAFFAPQTFPASKGGVRGAPPWGVAGGVNNQPPPFFGEFEIPDADQKDISALVSAVEDALSNANARSRNVILGALTQISARYMQDEYEAPVEAKKRQRK